MSSKGAMERPEVHFPQSGMRRFRILILLASLSLGACAASSPRAVAEPVPAPPPQPITEVFFYPTQGQSLEQQDRDRFECYQWAKSQSGFDPSAPNLAPHQRIKVEPAPPSGHDTAVGAVTGAIIGSIIGSSGRRTESAAIGAIAGGAIGSSSDASRQAQADQIQQHYDQQEAQRMANIEQQASRYRRALAACLEGRGYTVR